MSDSLVRQDILAKIKAIATADGRAPGRDRFESETGIKPHQWRGKLWRTWSDALAEAGFIPNRLQGSFSDDELLQPVMTIATKLGRFPSTSDLEFELRNSSPGAKTILARWKMAELAQRLESYAAARGEIAVAHSARDYLSSPHRPVQFDNGHDVEEGSPLGYVYMQRHSSDYKIGFTRSLNKRGRQIQIELPQEIELVHSILTDDPAGVESYWHRRFADKRTRGEWFKLTKADVAAFKKWSKIW